MIDKIQELEELFQMFHDFDISKAEFIENTLVLMIIIPWGSMWKEDDYSYTIRIELLNCNYFVCDYYVIKSKELIKISEKKYQKDTEKNTTNNPEDLNKLELSIQSSTMIEHGKYELNCISHQEIDFATLTITANDYRIFDQDGKEITLDTMNQWAKDWWEGIQSMWDEQRKLETNSAKHTWWQKLYSQISSIKNI